MGKGTEYEGDWSIAAMERKTGDGTAGVEDPGWETLLVVHLLVTCHFFNV